MLLQQQSATGSRAGSARCRQRLTPVALGMGAAVPSARQRRTAQETSLDPGCLAHPAPRPAPCCRTRRRRAPAPTASAAQPAASSGSAAAAHPSAFEELCAGQERRYIMVSGKGGVGKTSLSTSLAVRLAEAGHTTLIVSTDPAHSLSDSLAQDVSGGKPVPIEGTQLPLWGMEVDAEGGKAEWEAYNQTGEAASTAGDFLTNAGLGMIASQLKDLQLGELLNTPPPGLDEAVAIGKVVQFVQSQEYARFSRIVFDTAPTGHTLRLLALPDFVDASLEKVIRLRRKLSSVGAGLRRAFGAGEQQDELIAKLEGLRARVQLVQSLFRDASQTEFVIATIPTMLGVNESKRLLATLRQENIPCKRIVVNQLITDKSSAAFLKLRFKDQAAALHLLESDPALSGLQQLRAPLVDLEVRGVPALQYFGGVVWGQDVFERLNTGSGRRYYLLGGKGGVGKTSCSASLGLRCAADGHNTLVVSTDPAHSLSDAFDQDLSGGLPVQVTSPLGESLSLWGMQIDLDQAKEELREAMAGSTGAGFSEFLDSLGLGGWVAELKELQLGELLDTPPPGVDEAIAISKVVQFLQSDQYAHFDRIIFDTAPTGHTLRLLTLPDFLDASLGKVIRLRAKLTAAGDTVKSLFTGKAVEQDPAVAKIEQLRARMEAARALFHDATTSQFIIVTIPTVMAAAESARLASSLVAEGIPLKTLVINQVVPEGAGDKFLAARRADQARAMAVLESDKAGLGGLQLVEGPLLDLEVRGLPALQYFGGVVWK